MIEENRRGEGIALDISRFICSVQLVYRDVIELNNTTQHNDGMGEVGEYYYRKSVLNLKKCVVKEGAD